ncbi:MAG: hypothetical protein ISS36_03400 [Candidatus Aenigmarchaeota archaeon]|nr:hypothetical protein [Candidatus Aenigmarchaeota archaeon]
MKENFIEADENDNVLIIVEESIMNPFITEICNSLRQITNTVLLVYPDKGANLPNYPQSVKEAMEQATIILDCCETTDMYSELKQGLLNGRKIVYMLKPYGKFLKYYETIDESITQNLKNFLENSKEIEISIGNNTIKAVICNRPVIVDGFDVKTGSDTILPPASVSFAPIENNVNGKLEFNGFVENVSGSVRCKELSGKILIKNGNVECDGEIKEFFNRFDDQCLTIGHITFGTNPLITEPYEGFDTERAVGGICLGFGNNQGVFSGENTSNGHIDISARFDRIILKNEKGDKIILGGKYG